MSRLIGITKSLDERIIAFINDENNEDENSDTIKWFLLSKIEAFSYASSEIGNDDILNKFNVSMKILASLPTLNIFKGFIEKKLYIDLALKRVFGGNVYSKNGEIKRSALNKFNDDGSIKYVIYFNVCGKHYVFDPDSADLASYSDLKDIAKEGYVGSILQDKSNDKKEEEDLII